MKWAMAIAKGTSRIVNYLSEKLGNFNFNTQRTKARRDLEPVLMVDIGDTKNKNIC